MEVLMVLVLVKVFEVEGVCDSVERVCREEWVVARPEAVVRRWLGGVARSPGCWVGAGEEVGEVQEGCDGGGEVLGDGRPEGRGTAK